MIFLAWFFSIVAGAAVMDSSPPQDAQGQWKVDLYDPNGNERGTPTNPISISGATWSSRVVSGNATTTIKTGAGIIRAIVIGNGASGGVLTAYDATTGSGTQLAAVAAGTPSGGLLSGSGNPASMYIGNMDVKFSNGLTVVTSGAASNSFTVIYQ
jgi:hypothetical protein